MRWLERLVSELAKTCRDPQWSWNRTGQLCALFLALALACALVLWAAHG
jgi:hypothetical protein